MATSPSFGKADRESEFGFTLVELLVVILIIGILAAVAVPSFLGQRQRSNDAALKSDVRNVAMAMETYLTVPENAKKASINYQMPTENSGWYVLAVHEDGIFGGARNVPNFAPEGFPEIRVSEGAGIGVVTSKVSARPEGSFCIAANMNNSSYQVKNPLTENIWENMLYYDSRAGGLFEAKNLPSGGACVGYYNRINS